MKKKKAHSAKTISNKRARFDYNLDQTVVAGIVLNGAETKSLRYGHAILRGAFCTIKDDELWLNNMQINPLKTNMRELPEADRLRARKLLVTHKQLEMFAAARKQGENIIPIKLLTETRHIKVELGIGRGKKKYDKRQTIKKRDQLRQAKEIIV